MAVSPTTETLVAVQAEQIKQLTGRVDLMVKLAFSILVAFLGAAASFVFVIIAQLR